MATVIESRELGVGDVFFDPRRYPVNAKAKWHPAAGLRRVRSIRDIIVTGGHYRAVDYDVLDSAATGQLDLRVDIAVARVEVVTPIDAVQLLTELLDGELLTVWAAEGRLWI